MIMGIDVTASELMRLRGMGFSNQEIANQLDVSPATVVRIIGNQGFRKQSDKPKENPIEITGGSTLFRMSVLTKYVSGGNMYEVDTNGNVLRIQIGENHIEMTTEQLDVFIRDLLELRKYIQAGENAK